MYYTFGLSAWSSPQRYGLLNVPLVSATAFEIEHIVGVGLQGPEFPVPSVAVEDEGAHAARLYGEPEADNHVIAESVFSVAGLGGADAPGKGRFGLVAHGRGSLFGPRDRAVVQEGAVCLSGHCETTNPKT